MPTRTDRLLLANAIMGQFISGVATRMFAVSLPTIATALNADILAVSWALIAYQLAGICLSVVFGRLGDIHGRYAIYGAGFVIMTVSSVLCGLAPGVGWLIGFRLVQGIGAHDRGLRARAGHGGDAGGRRGASQRLHDDVVPRRLAAGPAAGRAGDRLAPLALGLLPPGADRCGRDGADRPARPGPPRAGGRA